MQQMYTTWSGHRETLAPNTAAAAGQLCLQGWVPPLPRLLNQGGGNWLPSSAPTSKSGQCLLGLVPVQVHTVLTQPTG